MARIPVQQTREITRLPPLPRVSTDVTPIAQGIGAIGAAIGTRYERQREADEQMRIIDMAKEFDTMRTEAKKNKSKNALNLNKELADRYDPLYERFVGSVEDPITRQNMETRFRSSYDRAKDWTRNYVMEQEDAHLEEVDSVYRSNLGEQLSNTPIGDFASILAKSQQATAAASRRLGKQRMTPERQAMYYQHAVDQYTMEQLNRWYAVDPLDTYNWYAQNREDLRESLSAEVFTKAEQMFRRQHPEAMTMKAYRHAMTKFGDDYIQSEAYLSDPGNWAEMGFRDQDYAYPMAAAARIRNFRNMNESATRQNQEEDWNQFMETFNQDQVELAQVEDMDDRFERFNEMMRRIDTDPSIPFEKRQLLRNKFIEANFYDNPLVHQEIRRGIDSGDISTPGQIDEWLGRGAGSDLSGHKDYLRKTQQKSQFGNINYFNRALNLRKDLPEDKRQAFRERLEASQLQYGLTANDPQLLDIADTLLQKEEFKVTPEGERIIEGFFDGLTTFGEQERYVFERPGDIQMEGIGPRGEFSPAQLQGSPQAPAGPAVVQPEQVDATLFNQYLYNTQLIPEETAQAKFDYMIEIATQIQGSPPTEEDMDFLERQLGQPQGSLQRTREVTPEVTPETTPEIDLVGD